MTVPPSTWGIYARKVYELEQRRGRQVYDRERFEEAVALDGIRRLSDRAADLLAIFQLDPWRLAECLIDGTAPRYAVRRDG